MILLVKNLNANAIIPQRNNNTDAGLDLYACLPEEDMIIRPGERKAVPTGLAIEMQGNNSLNKNEQFVGKVCSRSGLALKAGIFVLNSPGIIDAGYRGEISVLLFNAGEQDAVIKHGAKIAQLLIEKVVLPEDMKLVDELSSTDRGELGWGSSDENSNK